MRLPFQKEVMPFPKLHKKTGTSWWELGKAGITTLTPNTDELMQSSNTNPSQIKPGTYKVKSSKTQPSKWRCWIVYVVYSNKL